MAALEEEIANLNEQLKFKEKRRQEAESGRRYKLCEDITEEILIVKKQRCEKTQELAAFKAKEKKAIWYEKKKRERKSLQHSESAGGFTSDSDLPLSSPNSSMASTHSVVTMISDDERGTDIEQQDDNSESPFPFSLPVHNP